MSGATTLTGPAPTDSALFTALRSLLLQFLPSGVAVVRGQINQVAEPLEADFIVMWPLARAPLSVVAEYYHDGAFDTPPTPGEAILLQPTQATVQLDVHGPNGAENAQLVLTLARSGVAFDAMEAINPNVATNSEKA